MEKTDAIKELIGYLKIIFALVAATLVGLIGWFVQNYKSADLLLAYVGAGLIFLLIAVLFFINKRIFSNVNKLGGL